MEKLQREYFLREQLKAIKKELGEEDEQAAEIRELREKIEAAGMPEEAKKEALRELERLSSLPPAAAEYSVIRTYLGWLIDLPWQKTTKDNLDIQEARRVLDEDHHDLERVKERIIEFLAVRKLRQERAQAEGEGSETGDRIRREREGVILCFVGPPGVGKTSLGRSIARALGREFIRQSLGGVHDEAEIRGHRRTYVGAMPGRIIQAIRRVGSRNPVFMLDEVDKIGSDFRGDPASALLEVLDPEQNREFRDNYLDVPFDLSQVMFIATANVLDTIPAPLRDRMEIIQLSGYAEDEKLAIARNYLIPRQIRENGLRSEEISFEDDALRRIIREYTREAGVRELERQIGMICRKVATRVAAGASEQVVVTADAVPDYLGKPIYFYEAAERTQVPGVAIGLAWTPTGGDILFIEATKMKGNKGFITTGQLGEVMRESAQAALSYVRSKARELGIDEDAIAQSGHPPPRACRRHPQGRPLGGRGHGHGPGLSPERRAGAQRVGDDRRDHPARPSIAGGGHQRKGAGGASRRAEDGVLAAAQCERFRRTARSRAQRDDSSSSSTEWSRSLPPPSETRKGINVLRTRQSKGRARTARRRWNGVGLTCTCAYPCLQGLPEPDASLSGHPAHERKP
jgi:ATP-dependent Lon protease